MNNNSSHRYSTRYILEDIKCSIKSSCNCKLFVSVQIEDSGTDGGISHQNLGRCSRYLVDMSGFGIYHGVGRD